MRMKIFAFAISMLAAASAHAFDPTTDITELEWQEWPEFCRIAYVRSGYSAGSPYRRRISPDVRERGKDLLAQVGISGPHHFCTGIVLLHRAQRGTVIGSKRDSFLQVATGEFEYSYKNTSEDHPAYSVVSDYLGRALHLQSNQAKAYGVWRRAIELWPNDTRCYVTMAKAMSEDGHPDRAIEVLESFPDHGSVDTSDFLFAKATALHAGGRSAEARPIAEKLVQRGYAAKALLEKIKKGGTAGEK